MIAVVGSREDGYTNSLLSQLLVFEPFIIDFMPTNHHLQVVKIQEIPYLISSKVVGATTVTIRPPAVDILLGRIAPQEIAKSSLIGNFHKSMNLLNILNGVAGGRNTSMNSEIFLIHYRTDRQLVE